MGNEMPKEIFLHQIEENPDCASNLYCSEKKQKCLMNTKYIRSDLTTAPAAEGEQAIDVVKRRIEVYTRKRNNEEHTAEMIDTLNHTIIALEMVEREIEAITAPPVNGVADAVDIESIAVVWADRIVSKKLFAATNSDGTPYAQIREGIIGALKSALLPVAPQRPSDGGKS